MLRKHALCPTRVVFLLVIVGAIPLLTGCAQLGIAKVDDMDAMETKQTRVNNGTSTRLDTLDQQVADLDPKMQELSAQVDSLNTNVTNMQSWLEQLDIDEISSEAKQATTIAGKAHQNYEAMRTHYLQRLQAEHKRLEEELEYVKSLEIPKDGGAGAKGAKGAEAGGDAPKDAGDAPKGDGGSSGG